MNGRGATQVTLVLGGFLGKNVALEGLTALDGTARTHLEALCSALLGLHLRHDEQLHYLMDMGVRLALPALHPPFETQSTWYADGRRHDDAATAFQTKRPLYCKVRAPFRNFA